MAPVAPHLGGRVALGGIGAGDRQRDARAVAGALGEGDPHVIARTAGPGRRRTPAPRAARPRSRCRSRRRVPCTASAARRRPAPGAARPCRGPCRTTGPTRTSAGQVSWRSMRTVQRPPASVDLGPIEPELVDQLLVPGDATIGRRQRLVGEHAAQPGEAQLPTGGEARRAVAVVEGVGQRERRAVAVGRRARTSAGRSPHVKLSEPGGVDASRTVPAAASSPSKPPKRIAPPGRRSTSTGLGNHWPRCSGVVTARHTFSIGCG